MSPARTSIPTEAGREFPLTHLAREPGNAGLHEELRRELRRLVPESFGL